MKTFVILLSCLACCVVARRLSGTTKSREFLESIEQGERGYTYGGKSQQRQQFLLDVLLQVQKPLANAELIQMGQVLVTEPDMYIRPNDVILQEFLQLATSQGILGRNDVYNPVDMTNIRQLVGLQRFFVLARDYQVFQRNVVYARLYFNAVMFVDALTLAIRERPDTQDLAIPPMNEILPELYYDNYILYSAHNVDFEKLVDQVKGSGSRLLDFFGAILPAGKYGAYYPAQRERSEKYGGKRKEISAEIVLPVEQQASLTAELANDIQLDVAWKNIIIDQLAQTATEGIECGQSIEDVSGGRRYYQQGAYSGPYTSQYGGQSRGYGQGVRYYGYGGQDEYRGQYGVQSMYQAYGDKSQGFVDINELPKVSAASERLLPMGRKARGYSAYVNPFYGPRKQYGYEKQGYGTTSLYGSYDPAQAYGMYLNQYYGPRYQYGYGNQDYGMYGSYGPYGEYAPQYGYKGQQYGGLGQYGYNKLGYGSYYKGAYRPQKYQEYQRAKYDTQYKKYGSYYGQAGYGMVYGSAYTGPYAPQYYQGVEYGSYVPKYGSAYTGPYAPQYYQGAEYGFYMPKYYQGAGLYEPQRYQGAQYGYKGLKYGAYYGSDDQQYRGPYSYNYQKYGSYYGSPKYMDAYNYQKYGSSYTTPYGPLYYQRYQGRPYGAEYTKYGPYYAREQYKGYGDYYGQEYKSYYSTETPSKYGYKYPKYGYDSKPQYAYYEGSLGDIAQYITYAKKLSYERRGEILLQSIQELAARLNIERIVESVEGNTYKQQQYYEAERAKISQLMQLMRTLIEQVCEERSISKNSEATLNLIADIINGRFILEQQQLSSTAKRTLLALQQYIASILRSEIGPIYELTPLALFFGNLREPLTQQIIISYAELIAEYRQQLQPNTKEQLIADIAVQNVQITPLLTYTEYYDADLINLLDEKLLQSSSNNLQRLSQKVVARQQRLNYEPFTISMDIAVEQPQEVAVRVFLLPKIDYNGRRTSLSEYPQNYIVLDTFVERLQAGKNLIQRSSRQFNGYNNDATTISQLYYQVMTGQISAERPYQPMSIRQLPRNLLLPRGTNVNGGLPVEILVIATPLTQGNRQYLSESFYPQQISGFGIAAVGADQLPLGYPLDRPIYNEESLYVPNVKVIETMIQYDDVIRG